MPTKGISEHIIRISKLYEIMLLLKDKYNRSGAVIS